MAGWFNWLWTTESPTDVIDAMPHNITVDVLNDIRAKLKHVDTPTEKIHILEFRPAVLAPTANLSLIKRSWLGITNDVLMRTINNLRQTRADTRTTFIPRSAVLQELLQKHPRLRAGAK